MKSGNAMVSDRITVAGNWNVQQKLAARLLAIGYTQQSTAEQVGRALSTVQKWLESQPYQDYIQELHDVAWQRIEPGIMANVALAIEVQRDMLRGQVKPDDKRYLAAERLITRILDRLLYVEPAAHPSGNAPLGPSANVSVTVAAATLS